jgi:hypothetical protein
LFCIATPQIFISHIPGGTIVLANILLGVMNRPIKNGLLLPSVRCITAPLSVKSGVGSKTPDKSTVWLYDASGIKNKIKPPDIPSLPAGPTAPVGPV